MNRMIEYYGRVEDGKLADQLRKKISKELLNLEGKRVRIRIDKFSGKRSYRQNNLWHAYVGMVAKEIGYEHEELHEIAKYKFLKTEKLDERTGEILPFIKSTTELSKEEFGELVDNFIRWSAEMFSISLPMPGENWELQTEDEELQL